MTNRRQFLGRCAGAAVALGAVPPALAQATVTEGIDVSSYQGSINWGSVAAAGIKFAFCKATEGVTFTDSTFAANWAGAKANGIIRGAYHYARYQDDPIKEVRFFLNVVKPSSGDLQPVVDLESTGNTGFTTTFIRNWIQSFCTEMKNRLGKPGIVYTGFYYWRDDAGNSPYNYGFPLWHAQYAPSPTLGNSYNAWPTWTFWQYTSTGTVNGISGDVDRDQFNGSLTSLNSHRLP